MNEPNSLLNPCDSFYSGPVNGPHGEGFMPGIEFYYLFTIIFHSSYLYSYSVSITHVFMIILLIFIFMIQLHSH